MPQVGSGHFTTLNPKGVNYSRCYIKENKTISIAFGLGDEKLKFNFCPVLRAISIIPKPPPPFRDISPFPKMLL